MNSSSLNSFKKKKKKKKNYQKSFASSHPYSPWEIVALETNEN